MEGGSGGKTTLEGDGSGLEGDEMTMGSCSVFRVGLAGFTSILTSVLTSVLTSGVAMVVVGWNS